MKKSYYVKEPRPSLRLNLFLLWYIALDHFEASDVAWGISGTLAVIFMLFNIFYIWNSKGVHIFDENGKLKMD